MLASLLKRISYVQRVKAIKDLVLEKLDSLSHNQAAVLESLKHLEQRAPADNSVAEARQAALLREIREQHDALERRIAGLEQKLDSTREGIRSDLESVGKGLQMQKIGLAQPSEGTQSRRPSKVSG